MREAIRAGEASCLAVGHAFREENVFSEQYLPLRRRTCQAE